MIARTTPVAQIVLDHSECRGGAAAAPRGLLLPRRAVAGRGVPPPRARDPRGSGGARGGGARARLGGAARPSRALDRGAAGAHRKPLPCAVARGAAHSSWGSRRRSPTFTAGATRRWSSCVSRSRISPRTCSRTSTTRSAFFLRCVATRPSPPISELLKADHDAVGEGLKRVREAARDFAVPDWACASYTTLMRELEALETGLFEHVHLENHVLLPRFTR